MKLPSVTPHAAPHSGPHAPGSGATGKPPSNPLSDAFGGLLDVGSALTGKPSPKPDSAPTPAAKGPDAPGSEPAASGKPSANDKRPAGDNRSATDIINANPTLKNLGNQSGVKDNLKKQVGDFEKDPDAAYRASKVLDYVKAPRPPMAKTGRATSKTMVRSKGSPRTATPVTAPRPACCRTSARAAIPP